MTLMLTSLHFFTSCLLQRVHQGREHFTAQCMASTPPAKQRWGGVPPSGRAACGRHAACVVLCHTLQL